MSVLMRGRSAFRWWLVLVVIFLHIFITKPTPPMFESLDMLLKVRHYSYLCKEILCAKPFFEEILFYLKDNRELPAILGWRILAQARLGKLW